MDAPSFGSLPLPPEKAWFPPKRYGYGWGWPRRWQGQVTLIGYFLAFFAGTRFLRTNSRLFVAYTLGITAVLIALCWIKGEPPRWRWGKDS